MLRHTLISFSNLFKLTTPNPINSISQPIFKNSILPSGHIFTANMSCIVKYSDVLSATDDECVYIIDVREPSELKKTGCIPNSINIPSAEVEKTFKLSDQEFQNKFGRIKPFSDSQIIFYCQAGRRATTASKIVSTLGFCNIKVYEGSWGDWEAHMKK